MSLLLLMPAYQGKMNIETHFCLQQIKMYFMSESIEYDECISKAGSLVSLERNKLFARFYKSKYEYCLWLDADTAVLEPEKIVDMYLRKKDVIAAASPARPHAEHTFKINFILDKNKKPKTEQDLFKVDGIGLSTFMLSKKVAEKLVSRNQHRKFIDKQVGECWDLFSPEIFSQGYLGEDIRFCKHLRDNNVDIYVYPDIKIMHLGETHRIDSLFNFLKLKRK